MFGAWEVYLFTLTRNKPSKPIISSAARSCLVHGDYTTLNFHLINSWEKYFHWGILDSHWHRARELARFKCQSRKHGVSHCRAASPITGDRYVLGFAPALRFLRSQILCRLYKIPPGETIKQGLMYPQPCASYGVTQYSLAWRYGGT